MRFQFASRSRTAFLSLGATAVFATVPAQSAGPSPGVGDTAPDFATKNLLTRDPVTLSGARGKIVFLTFWASWCAPCRKELPVLENVQRKLGQDRASVFAVSFRENNDQAVRRWARDYRVQATLLEDGSGAIARQYGIHSIPHLFIIGRDGRILSVHSGYGEGSIDELVEAINAALRSVGEAAPSHPASAQ